MRKRRGWKKGSHLVRDEESGFVEYGENVRRDYYGVLKRKDQADPMHPQTFVRALGDPYNVYPQAPPFMTYDTSAFDASAFVYGTNIPTAFGPASHLFPRSVGGGIGQMIIGTDFTVS